MGAVARFCVFLAAFWCSAFAAASQSLPDFDSWTLEAEQVEQVLAVGAASDAALESLRNDVVGWRERFLSLKDVGDGRIETLKRRIAALPAAPEDGSDEPSPVAEARATLDAQLEQLQVPVIRAQLAFAHADGLVREIDEALRERQATALLRRLPSPLNPLNWSVVANDLTRVLADIPVEMADGIKSADARQALFRRLPGAILIAMAGALFLVRGGVWMNGLIRSGQRFSRPAAVLIVESFAVLLQLILPLAGLFLILSAISLSGLLGDTGTILFQSLSNSAVWAILGLWLVARIYPQDRGVVSPASEILPRKLGGAARRATVLLVAILALKIGLADLVWSLQLADLTAGYLSIGLIVPAAAAVYRLGRLYRPENIECRSDQEPETSGAFVRSVVGVLARVARFLASLVPIVALAGYINLADGVVFPLGFTFLLFAALSRLQDLVARLFSILRHGAEKASDGLTPVLINGVLSVAAVPLLALIWGARPSDLSEMWASLREGLTLGGVHISPASAILFVVVFGFGYVLTRFVQGVLSQTVLPRTRLELGAQRAMTAGAGYVGIFLSAVVAITATGIDLSNIAIVAGALSVGIGFGLQTIVSNFVSGIILLIERPVSEGDWIEVAGQMGIVKRISVRATRIETFDRTDVIVPNSDLVSGQVTNWTRGNLIGRAIIPVGVAYGSDTRKVESILREIAEAHPMVSVAPPPQVLFMAFGASSLDFEIRAILRDINFLLSVKSEINHQIAQRFAAEGIEIPFPQTDLWLRNPEAMSQGDRTKSADPTPPPSPRPGQDMFEAEDFDMGEGGDGDR